MEQNKIFLENLTGQTTDQVPFWFMRQAGRYLPEYRELRAEAGGFLNLAYNPEWASEVTMQPIRRYGMSAAILFSDILVIPQALGMDLRFETGEGPKLNALQNLDDIKKLNVENIHQTLNPIYETVSQTSQKLKTENFKETALIGFAGSPWTVACYMIEGGGSKNFAKTKEWALSKPDEFSILIDTLVEATSAYLLKQIEAGAEAIQLFDSWAGILDEASFEKWSIKPTKDIVEKIKEHSPETLIIGFPREAGLKTLKYVKQTGIQAVGLDYAMDPVWARDNLQSQLPVQGNLNPLILLEGGQKMVDTATNILEIFSNKPFIFNLGHGVIKETPPENVELLCETIRNFKR